MPQIWHDDGVAQSAMTLSGGIGGVGVSSRACPISPSASRDYDVEIVDEDGIVWSVAGLSTMSAAWEWIARQRMADAANASDRTSDG